jgi:hypothetical protein
MDRYSRNDHDSDVVRKALNVAPIPGISVTSAQTSRDVCPSQDQKGELFARCKIANDWKGIAIVIKIKFMSKLALTLSPVRSEWLNAGTRRRVLRSLGLDLTNTRSGVQVLRSHTPGPGKRRVLGMAARISIPAAEPRDGFELTAEAFGCRL